METSKKKTLTVEATINAPINKVWKVWTDPRHIIKWNNASDDWHTTKAENDVREGGRFSSRMEAKDGSSGFDFSGIYSRVINEKEINYLMDDGRNAHVHFEADGDKTRVTESFEAEDSNPVEMQQSGWQSIMDNFKKYVESSGDIEDLHFDILINASPHKVYETMIDKKHYSEWTAEFNPTSYYDGSWDKGSKILFIGTDKDGSQGGMVSNIKENIPDKLISIEHVGLYHNGKEIFTGAEVESWAGALETYTYTEQNGKTFLSVDLTGLMEYKSYFLETWPKALNKLKQICEK